MSDIEKLTMGETVFVRSRAEKGAVVGIHPPTITVLFLTGEKLEVQEGDFDLR